jgi:hypothetical protein
MGIALFKEAKERITVLAQFVTDEFAYFDMASR